MGLQHQCKAGCDDCLTNGPLQSCGANMHLDDFCDAVRKNIKDIYNMDPHAPKESTNILCSSCGR